MFVGHYAASLALRGTDKKASLGLLFLAVQFLDILFFPFVLLGIERIRIVENFTESTHFQLVYMPFTHSLLGALVWALAAYVGVRLMKGNRRTVALVVGLAVLSHWFFDLIVHTPDLPLWSDSSPKLGLGLWNNAVATYALEAVLLVAGLVIYLRSTRPTNTVGKYGMTVFVVILIAINAFNIFGPLVDDNEVALAVSALGSYFAFAGVAFWLDRKRV